MLLETNPADQDAAFRALLAHPMATLWRRSIARSLWGEAKKPSS
jgi:hypothetical protein